MRYNRQLMMAILHDKVHIAEAVNAKAISLDDAPQGYAEFDTARPPSTSSTPTAWSPDQHTGGWATRPPVRPDFSAEGASPN